jgi:hypothetical protein
MKLRRLFDEKPHVTNSFFDLWDNALGFFPNKNPKKSPCKGVMILFLSFTKHIS